MSSRSLSAIDARMSAISANDHAPILSLPPDILLLILRKLRTRDKKLLRQTCRAYYDTLKRNVPTLPSTFSISRLHIDQYRFMKYPLGFVQELIWEELCSDSLIGFCHDRSVEYPNRYPWSAARNWRGPLYLPTDCRKTRDDDGSASVYRMDWDWWSEDEQSEDKENENEENEDEESKDEQNENGTSANEHEEPEPWFSYWLQREIMYLKKLTTLTIRIRRECREYKLGIRGLDKITFRRNLELDGAYLTKSLGVALALLIFSKFRLRRQIESLNLGIVIPQLGSGSISLKDKDAFEYLTSISICVFRTSDMSRMKDDILVVCIQAAKKLKSLKLCFPSERTDELYGGDDSSPVPWKAVFLSKLFNKTHWPHLESFHIINNLRLINTNNDGSYGKENSYGYDALTDGRILPIANLGQRLHTLRMDNCYVNYRDLKVVRYNNMFPELMCIDLRHRNEAWEPDRIVSPDDLVSFLKGDITEKQFENLWKSKYYADNYGMFRVRTSEKDYEECPVCIPPTPPSIIFQRRLKGSIC